MTRSNNKFCCSSRHGLVSIKSNCFLSPFLLNPTLTAPIKYLSFACWVFFHAFVVVCWLFSKSSFSKNSLWKTNRVSNSLDPDQDLTWVQTVCKGNQQTTVTAIELTRPPGQQANYLLPGCFIPFSLYFDISMLWNSWILTYWTDPIPRVRGGEGAAGKIFTTMLLHSWFPLNWYATWPCSEKVVFGLFDPLGWRRGGGGGGRGRDCVQNICYYVAAFVFPFDLIYNMTIFWKSLTLGIISIKIFVTMLLHTWFPLFWYSTWPCSEKVKFDLLTPPPTLSPPRGLGLGLWSKIMFDMFHIYCTSICMWNFRKKYWQLTELLPNLIFDIWSDLRGQGVG